MGWHGVSDKGKSLGVYSHMSDKYAKYCFSSFLQVELIIFTRYNHLYLKLPQVAECFGSHETIGVRKVHLITKQF